MFGAALAVPVAGAVEPAGSAWSACYGVPP
jgi:hypothetical protein